MLNDEERKRERRAGFLKLSRHQTEARIATGSLDPKLDFVCPLCHGIYGRYQGRYKLHLRVCKPRAARRTEPRLEHHLPPPPPFEVGVFPPPATTCE